MQDQCADVGVADGVAVGRRANQGLGADTAAGADAVLDHHGLAQQLAHFLADQAGGDVGIAAGGGGTINVIARSGYAAHAGWAARQRSRAARPAACFMTIPLGVLLVTSLWSAGVPKMFGVLILLFSFSNIDRA